MTTAFVISYFPFLQVTVKIIMLSLGLFALLSLELYQHSSIELNFSFHDQSVVVLRLGVKEEHKVVIFVIATLKSAAKTS